jgi:hypothetical protein
LCIRCLLQRLFGFVQGRLAIGFPGVRFSGLSGGLGERVEAMAGKIFINYRRDDSIAVAGRLRDRLAETFGPDNLFMDLDSIPVGINFDEYLKTQVAQCDAMLSVIGPNWLSAKDETDQRRLDKPDDFVAVEIAAALSRDVLIIPVLVDGTRMPKASDLPASLKPLALRNAIQVRNTNFGNDAEILVTKMCEALGRDRKSGEVISHADSAFSQATNNLITLYRNLERRNLDLPFISITPFLIALWASVRLNFSLFVGIFLIIPTNLVILIRNLFPGEHWRYKPFFLKYFYYVWLWVWRGEAPTIPMIFIRPLLNIFLKEHFARRLRRLRQEIALRDGLADATRSALTGRLDSALERWNPPRYATLFFTFVMPAIIWLPEKLTDFVKWLGASTETVAMSPGALISLGYMAFSYLLAIPVTSFMAKRGLFLGADRIWFPGWQDGEGAYQKEREIFGSVELRVREAPIDLWVLGILMVIGYAFLFVTWDQTIAWWQSWSAQPPPEIGFDQVRMQKTMQIVSAVIFIVCFVIAAVRRARLGRA